MSSRRKISATKTLSSREFNQDTGRAKRAAEKGPVFITDRGKPSHVLLSIAGYQRLVDTSNIVDLLAMPNGEEVELEVPRLRGLYHAADLA